MTPPSQNYFNRIFRLLLIALFLSLLTAPSWAEVIDISGTLQDPPTGESSVSGMPVGLIVMGQTPVMTTTDPDGSYMFSSITVDPGDGLLVWVLGANTFYKEGSTPANITDLDLEGDTLILRQRPGVSNFDTNYLAAVIVPGVPTLYQVLASGSLVVDDDVDLVISQGTVFQSIKDISAGGRLLVEGGSSLLMGSFKLTAKSDVFNSGSIIFNFGGVLSFEGQDYAAFDPGGSSQYYDISVDKMNGTVVLSGSALTANSLVLTEGELRLEQNAVFIGPVYVHALGTLGWNESFITATFLDGLDLFGSFQVLGFSSSVIFAPSTIVQVRDGSTFKIRGTSGSYTSLSNGSFAQPQWDLNLSASAVLDIQRVQLRDSNATSPNGAQAIAVDSIDVGNNTNWLFVESSNTAPTADANGPYFGDEGSSISFDGTGSFDPEGDSLTYDWDFGDFSSGTGSTPDHTYADDGSYTIYLTVTDGDGLTHTNSTTATINNVAPTVEPIIGIPALVEVGVLINANAEFSDPGIDDTHTAEWDWGDGSNESGTVTQGSGSGSVNDSHTYTTPGVYTIQLTVTDDDGGSGTSVFQYAVVYDPSEGFVTGGGWIDSPAGAYVPDPSLMGKASFGFVSKYKKWDTTLTGNTEFHFQAGDLNFHSDTYHWLLIAGPKAAYKGIGKINGTGNYGFMLIAIDAKLHPVWDTDRFRIQIWDIDNNDAIVYDNEIGVDLDSDPTTEIRNGSIVIHRQ